MDRLDHIDDPMPAVPGYVSWAEVIVIFALLVIACIGITTIEKFA